MKATATFKQDRETKNTMRYQEQPEKGKPPIIGTLYVQKYLDPPTTLTVTIEGDE